MGDLFGLETKLLEQRTKVELNSKFAENIIRNESEKYTKDLDNLCDNIKSIIFNDTEELTLVEYEQIAMKLSLLLYDLETVSEYTAVRLSVSKVLEEERYTQVFLSTKGSGPIGERELITKSTIQVESMATILSKHIYQIIDKKKRCAYELLATVKKLISSRISSNDYNNL